MFKSLIYKDKWRILIISIIISLTTIASIVPFDYFGEIIDGITKNTMTSYEIKNKIIFMIGSAIFFYIANGINEYIMFSGYNNSIYNLQKIILEKVLKQTPEFFKIINIGEIMSRINSDAEEYVAPFFGYGIYTFAKGIVENIIIFIFITYKIGIKFSLFINIPFLILSLVMVFRNKKIDDDYKKMTSNYDLISEKTLEAIKGIRIVRAYNLYNVQRKEYIENIKNYSSSNLIFSFNFIIGHALNILAVGISYFFLISYGYYQYSNNFITFGDLISISLVMTMMAWPYSMLSAFIMNILDAILGFRRINQILDFKDIVNENVEGKKLIFKDKIEFRNFNFYYDENEVLKNINLTINKGETVAIIGKTGSGKSTLVKQLVKLFDNRNIFIDDIEINDYSVKSIRENIAYSPQEYFIFSTSIKNNILFNRNLDDKLDYALHLSDLKKDVDNFKEGLETLVGENGLSLSGGQKQRISIARALISNPEILIFDDSLSALDTNTEKNIIDRLKIEREGKTNIIVSHRLSSIIHADKIVLLNNGEIEDIGNHSELLERSKWYYNLYQYQNRKGDDLDE